MFSLNYLNILFCTNLNRITGIFHLIKLKDTVM